MSSTSAGNISPLMDRQNFICFEQPLNERVRNLLRMEFLFIQVHHHLADYTVWGRRATLHSLLDILVVLRRGDMKTDIIKELTEQHTALHALKQHAGVDHQRLTDVLDELESATRTMHGLSAQAASTLLHDKEFIAHLVNRSAIPGGTCGFDLPSYQHWLGQPCEHQSADVEDWLARIEPYQIAASLILRLLRTSQKPSWETAPGGLYIRNLTGPCQLLRVFVPTPGTLYPQISADKRRFSIRFMEQKCGNERTIPTQHEVDFQLAHR